MGKKRLLYIDVLRVIAIFFILNYHLDVAYPDRLKILASGGEIGNNLFFMISGYTLITSIDRAKWREFPLWYKKRIGRLLPALLLFYAIPVITHVIKIDSFKAFHSYFIFPTIYWFTGVIIYFYIAIFFVEKVNRKFLTIGLIVLALIGHYIQDDINVEVYNMGFIAMLIGCEEKRFFDRFKVRKNVWYFLVLMIAAFGGYLLLKLMYRVHSDSSLIHLMIGVATLVFSMSMIWLGEYTEGVLQQLLKNNCIKKSIIAISVASIHIYLVQIVNRKAIFDLYGTYIVKYIPFPVSYILCFVLTIVLGVIVMQIEKSVKSAITDIIKKK